MMSHVKYLIIGLWVATGCGLQDRGVAQGTVANTWAAADNRPPAQPSPRPHQEDLCVSAGVVVQDPHSLLVNVTNANSAQPRRLPDDFVPELMSLEEEKRQIEALGAELLTTFPTPTKQLRPEAFDAYLAMMRALYHDSANLNLADKSVAKLALRSGYRTFAEQCELLKANNDALAARPGHSEHHLGTATDIAVSFDEDLTYVFIQDNVKDCGTALTFDKNNWACPAAAWNSYMVHRWLAAMAYQFGFVMSYPDEFAPTYTGYVYEPWHYRYIGVDAATDHHDKQIAYQKVLSLQEYLDKHAF